MENKLALLLLSGGIDSTTLLAKLTEENYHVIAISFYYSQKHKIEIDYAKLNAEKYCVKKHQIIELDKVLFNSSALVNPKVDIENYIDKDPPKKQVNAYVPFRNNLFISIALSLAESMNINEIYLAFNNDDQYNFWDCTPEFIKKINAISSLNTSIKVKAPFIDMSKTEVIKLAKQLNVNLENTITCYQPEENLECGVCLSCITKLKALKNV